MVENDPDLTQKQTIERLVADFMAAEHVPGLALAINRDGQTWLCRGFGQANLELSVPADANSVFEIASLTKPFTAIGILILAEQGRLTLHDTLGQHVPDLPPAWSDIALHHVLAHQSGIPSYTEADGYWEGMGRDRSRQKTLDLVRDSPLNFQPGERYTYDNTGFYLLGLVTEAVSSQSYGDFLHDVLFQPLDMARTFANDYARLVPGRASGYVWRDGAYENRPYYSLNNTFSAGCLLSTVADLARWDLALDGESLLTRASKAAMWQPYPSAAANEHIAGFQVGLGWFLLERFGRRVAAHNGGILGFVSSFMRFLDDRLSIALLANASHVPEPHRLVERVAAVLLEQPDPAPGV